MEIDQELEDIVRAFLDAIRQNAKAVYPTHTAPGEDASGGAVGSLTEAVMGVTAGLFKIANALDDIAGALEPPLTRPYTPPPADPDKPED